MSGSTWQHLAFVSAYRCSSNCSVTFDVVTLFLGRLFLLAKAAEAPLKRFLGNRKQRLRKPIGPRSHFFYEGRSFLWVRNRCNAVQRFATLPDACFQKIVKDIRRIFWTQNSGRESQGSEGAASPLGTTGNCSIHGCFDGCFDAPALGPAFARRFSLWMPAEKYNSGGRLTGAATLDVTPSEGGLR